MDPVEPFFREAGAGPGVVCVHANASTSGQWRGLMDLLAPNFHVFAPDLYGSGKSPQWPSDQVIRLQDEAALIEPVLFMAGKRSTQSAHGVARLLTSALPRVELAEFENLGHMGPVTHPTPVNEAIRKFFERADI
jgi:pimeloyl-ACP methyl ester carboxylesterase